MRRSRGLGWTEAGSKPLLEAIQEPSLNINSIRSADVGEKARNVIPTSAAATLDLRLVKGNDHKRQVEKLIRHIQRQGFQVLDRTPSLEEQRRFTKIATVIRGPGYNAERTLSTIRWRAASPRRLRGAARPSSCLRSAGRFRFMCSAKRSALRP